MTQYELIPHHSGVTSIPFNQQSSSELAYEDDPATSVMQSLANGHTLSISESTPLDDAIHTMKTHHVTLMLVTHDTHVTGILSSEDLLGEKPITLQQRSRIERENIGLQVEFDHLINHFIRLFHIPFFAISVHQNLGEVGVCFFFCEPC